MLRRSCSTGKALFDSPLVPSSDSTARAGLAAPDRASIRYDGVTEMSRFSLRRLSGFCL